LVARGLQPKLMKLDNEASKLLKTYLHQQNITFQLVPPYSHRQNLAERVTRSFKDHLIAGLCSTDKSFTMHLWDRLLPQSVITLNMLRTSRINPKLSASTHIYGQYDFNRAPMAPPGTRIIAHGTPNRRRTWAPHGQDGWYIGPALEHYRCYTVYINKTRGERVVETVDFFSEAFKLPFPSAQDLATKAAAELTHDLLHPQPAGPFCKVGDEQTLALKRLADIFEGATRQKMRVVIPPRQNGRKCCTSEGAKYSFTSEGAKHNNTTKSATANYIITLDAKFAPQTTHPSQKSGNTTNNTCYGEMQCQPKIQFVTRHDN
jgi:hypothetical protein